MSRWILVLGREPLHDEIVTLREEIEGLGWTGRELHARLHRPRPTSKMVAVVPCACSHVKRLHDDSGACTLCSCAKFVLDG